MTIKHEFVEFIPDELDENTIYISIPYRTAIHKCLCGCRIEVVTPLSPTDWRITFDGETVSLYPSIGNWSFECSSHYWIKHSSAVWAERWSVDEIRMGRDRDKRQKQKYYESRQDGGDSFHTDVKTEDRSGKQTTILRRFRSWVKAIWQRN